MQIRRIGLIGFLLSLMVGIVIADDVAVPHTFSTGETISAAEMNENFDALEAGINANAAAALVSSSAFFNTGSSGAISTTSTTFVTVPGLSRIITLDESATVVVMVNAHSVNASGRAQASVTVDGSLLHSDGSFEYGMGYTTHSSAWTPISVLAAADLGSGTYTIETVFKSLDGVTVNFNYPLMVIMVFPQ